MRRNAEGPSSVMREWVDELTGRADRASTAPRVPTESEISTLVSMFPNLDRQVIVAALQQRYVLFFFLFDRRLALDLTGFSFLTIVCAVLPSKARWRPSSCLRSFRRTLVGW
jgi:hypothetical protein